ncbi:MAG TPA: serine--tRNA ligase, partial [Candidatus Paceibacterota bacterium]|nr:serine--tRNA ligase [Candidatus Paceibacterota bacterium]
MLDIKFIRENKDLVALGAKKKHIPFDVDALIAVDDKRRTLMTSIEAKRAEQNVASDAIAKAAPVARAPLLESMKTLKANLQKEEETLK